MKTMRVIAKPLLRGTILRNVIFLIVMSVILAISILTPNWASQIMYGLGCQTEPHFTPPGGSDGGTNCTGGGVCYSAVNSTYYFITLTMWANAWCGNATVLSEAYVDFTYSDIVGYAGSYSVTTGRPVATLTAHLGCDPGDFKHENKMVNYDNCDEEVAGGALMQ